MKITAIFILVLFAFSWSLIAKAGGNTYNCERCESEPKLDECYKSCTQWPVGDSRWENCSKACNASKNRDECLTTCFPVCEKSGGLAVPGVPQVKSTCDQCKGTVILVKDNRAEDGARIQVCKGQPAAPKSGK